MDSSFVLSLYALITASYVPSAKACPVLFTSIATAANAGVEYAANGNDNVAAIKIAFICFLLLFFNLTSPSKYIIQNVIISRINDNDFHSHCQLATYIFLENFTKK